MRIQKIKKIENFGVYKSFDWDKTFISTKPKQQTLQDINIIYGKNYSGKTTLSRIFRSIEKQIPLTEEPYILELLLDDGYIWTSTQIQGNAPAIRVFNSDYRKDNLSFLNDTSQNGEIKSFAVIGEDNVKINNEINVRAQQLGVNIRNQETGLYKKRLTIETNLDKSKQNYTKKQQYIDKQKKLKATVAENSIKQQASIFGKVTYNVPALELDILNVLKSEYIPITETERNECLSLIKEDKKEFLEELPFLGNDYTRIVERAKGIIEYKIGKGGKIDELLRDFVLSAWVRDGMKLQEKRNSNICKFCGNVISDKRWNQIKNHFDTESERLHTDGEFLISEIKKLQNRITATLSVSSLGFYSSLQDKATKLIEEYHKEANKYNEELNSIIKQLEDKLKNITQIYIFEESEYSFDNFHNIIREYNKLTYKANRITINKGNSVEKAQEKLRLQEVYDFVKSIGYEELIDEANEAHEILKSTSSELDEINEKIRAIEKEISELKKQLHDVSRGAELVNQFLSLLDGFTIRLVPKTAIDGKQVYFDVERDNIPARNLSEGECSIIAFCYFIARLKDTNTQNSAPLLFIDDPICSLDSNHIFFVYSLIRYHIIEKNNFSQLFISTHNLDFLKYLKRLTKKQEGRDKNYNICWLLIERMGEESHLAPMPRYLRDHVTEYEYLFSQIYACATAGGENDTNYGIFYNFGNNARKFLELYTYFKRPGSKPDDVMEELFDNRVYSLLVERVNNEFSHLMGNLERGASSLDYREIQLVANLILKAIKKHDEQQYESLLSSVGIKETT